MNMPYYVSTGFSARSNPLLRYYHSEVVLLFINGHGVHKDFSRRLGRGGNLGIVILLPLEQVGHHLPDALHEGGITTFPLLLMMERESDKVTETEGVGIDFTSCIELLSSGCGDAMGFFRSSSCVALLT